MTEFIAELAVAGNETIYSLCTVLRINLHRRSRLEQRP